MIVQRLAVVLNDLDITKQTKLCLIFACHHGKHRSVSVAEAIQSEYRLEYIILEWCNIHGMEEADWFIESGKGRKVTLCFARRNLESASMQTL